MINYSNIRMFSPDINSCGVMVMKRGFFRSAAAVLIFIFIFSVLAGCSASRPIKSRGDELRVIGRVGDFDVLYEELRYLTLNYKEYLKSIYGDKIWDDEKTAAEHRAELEALVYSTITANYAILTLAREVMIEADDKTIADAVDRYMDDFVEEVGGRGEYKSNLKKYYMTDHFFRFTTAVEYCRSELYYVYVDDLRIIESDEDRILEYIMGGECVRTLHVYIENGERDDVDENRRLADQVRDELLAGADIKKIIGSSVNEDFSLTTTDGYYFFRGEMLKGYEDAAFGAQIGGVSEVVETAEGFYIIQRLELEPSYVLLNLQTLAKNYQYAKLDLMIEEKRSELSFEINEYGSGIDLTKIG